VGDPSSLDKASKMRFSRRYRNIFSTDIDGVPIVGRGTEFSQKAESTEFSANFPQKAGSTAFWEKSTKFSQLLVVVVVVIFRIELKVTSKYYYIFFEMNFFLGYPPSFFEKTSCVLGYPPSLVHRGREQWLYQPFVITLAHLPQKSTHIIYANIQT